MRFQFNNGRNPVTILPMPITFPPSRPEHRASLYAWVILLQLLALQPTALAASGQQNPIIAGMEAMLDAMGYQQKPSNPFPETDPFAETMPGSSAFGSSPWSGLGGMPGMSPWSGLGGMPGMSPWTGLGGMLGMSPWSGLGGMPGMSPWSGLGGMPGISSFGSASPQDYLRPGNWSGFTGSGMRRFLPRGDPGSPTHELDGMWIGQNGERLWFRNGWLRAYRDVSSDARALLRRPYLFIGIPETKEVFQYEYGLRGDYLALRDANGTVQLFRRLR